VGHVCFRTVKTTGRSVYGVVGLTPRCNDYGVETTLREEPVQIF
jgi:hypothetical protein